METEQQARLGPAPGDQSPTAQRSGAERQHAMILRMLIVIGCLLAGTALLAWTSKTEVVPTREPLATFPMELGEWRGRLEPDFDQRMLEQLGADEYLNRTYSRTAGWVGLYVGYYQSQRRGDTMHSPINCLPGAGWTPVSQERIAIPVTDEGVARTVEINDFVIEKGLDRLVVLYWYQSNSRVVASEYWGKIYTVLDAVRYNRTDGALVRIIVPIEGDGPSARMAARQTGVAFVQKIFPLLGRHLPS